jgi:hypothetical protein
MIYSDLSTEAYLLQRSANFQKKVASDIPNVSALDMADIRSSSFFSFIFYHRLFSIVRHRQKPFFGMGTVTNSIATFGIVMS